MSDKYILEGHEPVACDDLMTWGKWMGQPDNKRVGKTKIGDVEISTVFLGRDHRFTNTGEPILFETMIFGGEHDQFQERYSTWNEAVEGHKRAEYLVLRPQLSEKKVKLIKEV